MVNSVVATGRRINGSEMLMPGALDCKEEPAVSNTETYFILPRLDISAQSRGRTSDLPGDTNSIVGQLSACGGFSIRPDPCHAGTCADEESAHRLRNLPHSAKQMTGTLH